MIHFIEYIDHYHDAVIFVLRNKIYVKWYIYGKINDDNGPRFVKTRDKR